jgi:hypothetical protein
MVQPLTVLLVLGAAGIVLGAVINLLATSRLLLSLKQLEPTTFVRLGAPTGLSPPDPRYGSREMQRYILAAEYRASEHKVVRLYGGCARLGIFFLVTGMLLLILVMCVRALIAS